MEVPHKLRPAAFVDRDGTINVEVQGALSKPEQIELLPGAAQGLRQLRAAGYSLVCITNQSAIGRGWMSEQDFERVDQHLRGLLREEGVELDLVLHCPHHPSEGIGALKTECRCRKPSPGMFEDAVQQLQLDGPNSWVVGDAARDLEAGVQVGARPILVATGKGSKEYKRLMASGRPPELFLANLAAAAEHICAQR